MQRFKYLFLRDFGSFIKELIPEAWIKSYVLGYVEKGSHLKSRNEYDFFLKAKMNMDYFIYFLGQ